MTASTPPGVPRRLGDRSSGTTGESTATLARVRASGVDQALIDRLTGTRGLRTDADALGLLALHRGGASETEIRRWAALGSLATAARLDAKDVPVEVVAAFTLPPEGGLEEFQRMFQAAARSGMRAADLRLWHTGGVLSLTPPYLVQTTWASWRSVAVHRIGMRRAAVAAAAGLSPQEAVTQVTSGEFHEPTLRLLGGLRAS